MSKLSIVATPIGNLGDITLRAIQTLQNADLIVCEDTRVTKKLLSHFIIQKTCISFHSHNQDEQKIKILSLLREGKNLALVTDAGTPGISDPGLELVSFIRKNIQENEIKIDVIPGPSALVAGISIAGVPCADFLFLGFLPHKKGRQTLFGEIANSQRTVIFYESPHRIQKTIDSLIEFCGDKRVTICRELTKIHEEVVSGKAVELKEFFEKNPEKVRGEFVVLVSTF
jgi:16S rRNA (cytidine1402-2'-O)-methyltransferase